MSLTKCGPFNLIKCLRPIPLSLQSLLSVGGISVMYKVQLLGPQNVLHKYEPFLLNPPICMLLYLGCTDEILPFKFLGNILVDIHLDRLKNRSKVA